MTVLQITPGLPPVYGPYKKVPAGARYYTAFGLPAEMAPYPDRLGLCWHLVNWQNIGGTAEQFHRNHFTQPGDKLSGSGSLHGVSYHGVIGGTKVGDIVVSLDETAGPNAAGTIANQRMIHMVMLMGDWSNQDERHEHTLETAAQFAADVCLGFGIPNRWHHVYDEPDPKVRLQRAIELTNDNRDKIGQFAHRDITAAYQTLMRAGMTAKAAPWKNSHGDCGSAFPWQRLINRTQQIIDERLNDMDRLCNIREIPADWPASPCVTHPGFYVDHGGVLEPITAYQAQVRSQQKSIKGDPNVPDSISAIDRNTLKAYRLHPGTFPHNPINLGELGPT